MSGTIKIIVNTLHPMSIHCNFLQNTHSSNDLRYLHYAHNCLMNSPVLPVDVLYREVSEPLSLPFPASPRVMQLNHYYIRSCQHFEDKKYIQRLAMQYKYGNEVPKWFERKINMGKFSSS